MRPAPQPLAGFRFAYLGDFAPADFGALGERLHAVAELILAVEVLLLQPAQVDDFGIRERGGVHVLGAADGRVAVHHLRDETRFALRTRLGAVLDLD